MDYNVLIDKKTYEVYDDYPDAFICDKDIAYSIAQLNKKGYRTISSCAGHCKFGFTEQNNVDIEFLQQTQNDKHFIIREIKKRRFRLFGRTRIVFYLYTVQRRLCF